MEIWDCFLWKKTDAAERVTELPVSICPFPHGCTMFCGLPGVAAPTVSVDAWWYWISYRIRPWFRWAMISSCRLYWSNAHWAGLLRIY